MRFSDIHKTAALLCLVMTGAPCFAAPKFSAPKAPAPKIAKPKPKWNEKTLDNAFAAAEKSDFTLLGRWLRAHPIKERDERGFSLLHFAATTRPQVVSWLLARGAEISAKDKDGQTPIFLAAMTDNAPVIALLAARAASLETLDKGGNTVLQMAAISGSPRAVTELLKRGARVDARGSDGQTALILAALLGRAHVVQILLKNGADARLKNRHDLTALDLATTMAFICVTGDKATQQQKLDQENYAKTIALLKAATQDATKSTPE